jgi:hypothetical protein
VERRNKLNWDIFLPGVPVYGIQGVPGRADSQFRIK